MEGFQPTSKVPRAKHVNHSDPDMGANLQSNTICNLQSNREKRERKKNAETHAPPGKIVLGLVARAFPGYRGRGLVGCENRAAGPPRLLFLLLFSFEATKTGEGVLGLGDLRAGVKLAARLDHQSVGIGCGLPTALWL